MASDYAGKNATFQSKAVSYIRQFIDYIQLAEYEGAPEKDVNRLIFGDDIPRRERAADTMSKVRYIPLPVREQLDASVQELEPAEMRPVYTCPGRAQNLLAGCIFVGVADKSAFTLLSQKVTKAMCRVQH